MSSNKITVSLQQLETSKNQVNVLGPLKIRYVIDTENVVDIFNNKVILNLRLNTVFREKIEKILLKTSSAALIQRIHDFGILLSSSYDNETIDYPVELVNFIETQLNVCSSLIEEAIIPNYYTNFIRLNQYIDELKETLEQINSVASELHTLFIENALIQENHKIEAESIHGEISFIYSEASILKPILNNPLILMEGLINDVGFPKEPSVEDPYVVCYIKNLYDKDDPSQTNGGYFLYNYTTKKWNKALLGTHIHENKEMLDAIGQAYDSIGPNDQIETKFLSVKKIANSKSSLIDSGVIKSITLISPKSSNYDLSASNLSLIGGHGTGAKVNIGSILDIASSFSYNIEIDIYGPSGNAGRGIGYHPGDVLTFTLLNTSFNLRVKSVDNLGSITEIHFIYPLSGKNSINANQISLLGGHGTGAKVLITSSTNQPTYKHTFTLSNYGNGYRATDILTCEVLNPFSSEPSVDGFITFQFRIQEISETFSYEFKAAWQNVDLLPEKPTDGKEYFVKLDTEGKIRWSNEFASNQCFLKLNQTVSNLNGSSQVIFNDVNLDPELDTLLVFRKNMLIPDVEYNYDDVLRKLTILLESDYGDTITVLVVRNTSAEMLKKLSDQYISKSEAIQILSNGKINLEEYAKKTSLNNYALRNHAHTNYAARNHSHHGVYADFIHNHDGQYVSKAELNNMVASLLAINPDVIDAISQIASDLNNLANAFVLNSEFVAKTTIINSRLDDLEFVRANGLMLNTNTGLITTNNGQNIEMESSQILTKYLEDGTIRRLNLEEYLDLIYSTMQDLVDKHVNRTKNDIVVTSSAGVYWAGDIIPKNTKIEDIIKNMLTVSVAQPKVEIIQFYLNNIDVLKDDTFFVDKSIFANIDNTIINFVIEDAAIPVNIICEVNGNILIQSVDGSSQLIISASNINTNVDDIEIKFYATYYYEANPSTIKQTKPVVYKFKTLNPIFVNNRKYLPNKHLYDNGNRMYYSIQSSNSVVIEVPKQYNIRDILVGDGTSIIEDMVYVDGSSLAVPKPEYDIYSISYLIAFENLRISVVLDESEV